MNKVIVSHSPVIKVTGLKVYPLVGLAVFILIGFISMSAYVHHAYPKIIEKTITVRDTVIVTKEKIKIKKVYNLDAAISSIRNSMKITDSKVETKERISTLHGYTPFEIAMYFLKAHESFRPWEYPDGDYPSKGFGLNLTPDHVKWATKKLGFNCKSRNWTFKEGQFLLREYWKEMKDSHPEIKDDFKLVALLLHKYNTGNTKTIYACCTAKKGCGSKNRKIRKAHNERRDFEVRLYNHKITLKEIEMYKALAIQTDAKWKNY